MHRFLLLFIILSCALTIGSAQRFRYNTYQGESVPFKKVNEVIEDNQGYIWLATDQGLFRFDGQNFEDHNTSLQSRYIKSFVSKHRDTLLFSNDNGIFKLFYAEKSVRIDPWLTRSDIGNKMGYPTQIYWDSLNRLWVGQLNGSVLLFQDQLNNPLQLKVPDVEKSPKIVFGEDTYGNIWVVVSGEGLYRCRAKEGTLERVAGFDGARDLWIQDNRMLVAGEGLYDISMGADGRILRSRRKFVTNKPFTNISADGKGKFYLTSGEAIFTVDSELKSLSAVYGSNDPHRVEQLPFTDINHLYFSSDPMPEGGTLWVSTDESLGLLYTSYFKSVIGMAHDNVLGLAASGEHEVLISKGNVFQVDTRDKSFKLLAGLNRVTAIATNGNSKWFATADGQIMVYNGNTRIKQYDLSSRGGGIFYMQADHLGEVWFCQAPLDAPIKGIAKITAQGTIQEYGETEGFQSRILVLDEGGRNELYVAGIGADGYLFAYDREADRFINKSLPFPFKVSRNFEVHDLAVDKRGLVWMGTTDGLLRYDTERIQRISLGPHTMKEVRSVCAMPDGTLWLATDTSGLLHLDQDLNYVPFDESSGTPSKIAAYRSMVVDGQNYLWAGTAEGAVYSTIQNPTPMSTPTPEISLSGQDLADPDPDALEFGQDDDIRFVVNAVSFPGEEIKYEFKSFPSGAPSEEIEDLPWTVVPASGELRLRNLKAGSYTLQVQAQKPGGFAWSTAAEQEFLIRKPWYATTWGIILLVLGAALFFWYGIRLWIIKKTRQLRTTLIRKEKELIAKEEELTTQMNTLKSQRNELKSAGVTIYLLLRLLRQIPPRANWKEVLPILCKLVELPTGMDAFELAFESGNDMRHYGFQKGQKKPQKRAEEFNEKDDLTSYVLTNKKPILIHDIDKEAGQYINHKDNKGYHSRIYVPFEQVNGAEAVLCAYGKDKNRFVQRDMTVLQILATFLSVNIIDELR
ncbi:MAG: GAF domain-containing protein [Eudoraea sp.]|nr:GAF domain-containing protein [Eudoraea sp.]NNK31372.1 GAF domain-containing protein [Flavobacteriaceae bacterium]